MGAALEQAALALETGELPIGAVAVAGGEIVARSYWRSSDGLLAHPELLALQQANRRGLTLVTTLEPCLLCMAAAMFAFAERVVFALESPTDGGTTIGGVWNPAAGSVAPYRFPSVEGGVRREESVGLVREFLRREPASPFAPWAETLI
ncbi:MAG TPA: deaminase [Gaiellaceae bacterium]